MSRVFQPKTKELAKVRVISSSTYSEKRSRYNFVGLIKRGNTAFVTTQKNNKTCNCSFVDDTSSLTKKVKNDVVRFFSDKENKGKSVVYLVVPKEKRSVK